jgi:hypothetical protein
MDAERFYRQRARAYAHTQLHHGTYDFPAMTHWLGENGIYAVAPAGWTVAEEEAKL